jgi:single-strand DNA-binding protein
MANLNKVMLIGNLTRDPEVRYTPKGTAVTDIGLAVNRSYTTDSGEKREEATFVDITLWGRQAEIAGQYMKKGNPIYIEGRLQMDSWQDKQTGQNRTRLKIVGDNFQFLGSREGGGGGGGGAPQGQQGGQQNYGGGGGGQPAQQQPQQPQGDQQNYDGGGGGQQQPQQQQAPPQNAAPSQGGGADFSEEDDDIPF